MTILTSFRRRKFLQRANASKELASGSEAGTGATEAAANIPKSSSRPRPQQTTPPHDDFADLLEYVEKGEGVVAEAGVVRISGEDETDNPSIAEVKRIRPG